MRAKSMLLCKAPFTPRYDNVVTGCTSQELYTRLAISGIQFPFSSIRTEFYETDTSLKFSLTLANYTIPPTKIRLDEYNYIAFKEDDNKISFWFIDGWEIENAFEFPTVTIECTKDFWHTYCLDLSINDTYKQHIIRNHVKLTKNDGYDYNRPIYFPPISLPSRKSITINRRVLWAKVKINSTYSKEEYNSVIGLNYGYTFDGSILTCFIPLFIIDEDNKIIDNITNLSVFNYTDHERHFPLLDLTIDKDSVTIDSDVSISSNTRIDYSLLLNAKRRISQIAEHPMVLSISLTSIPPIRYGIRKTTLTQYSIDIDLFNDTLTSFYSVVKINGIPSITGYGGDREDSNDIDSFTEVSYDIPELNVSLNYPDSVNSVIYPYLKRYCVIGNNQIEIPKPIKNIKIRCVSNKATDGYSAEIYLDNLKYVYNIEASPSAILPINSNIASEEEALYGSSYRDSSFLLSGIISATKARQNVQNFFSEGGGTKEIVNGLQNYKNLRDIENEYYSEYRTPDNVTSGFVVCSSTIYGDYPFIMTESIFPEYIPKIENEFMIYGELTSNYDYITIMHREKFSFIKCDNSQIYSAKISQKCNDIITDILNRGVHLWNINNITSLNQIGDYSIENAEV